jgi:hypothetical protein
MVAGRTGGRDGDGEVVAGCVCFGDGDGDAEGMMIRSAHGLCGAAIASDGCVVSMRI